MRIGSSREGMMHLVTTFGFWFLVLILSAAAFTFFHMFKPLPDGASYKSEPRSVSTIEYLNDTTWIDSDGQRHVEQEIFDAIFEMIEKAEKLILVDMFLYNDFQGPEPETNRALSSELTQALIAKKSANPDIQIVVISDPLNTVYGGLKSPHFTKLKSAGISVVLTDLPRLRDSNFFYSYIWRVFIRVFGNSHTADTLPNPLGQGRVSIRSYLELANFKANHRKTILADKGDGYQAIVTSANPHDGSSAHRNSAVRFDGLAVADLLATENAVLKMSGAASVTANIEAPQNTSGPTVQIVTERQIKKSVIAHLNRADEGSEIDVMMFYIADRDIIKALKSAHKRGARIRILLDSNADAFGHQKNGIPNRPVARELHKAGFDVKWCSTQGEQCHYKQIIVSYASGETVLIAGSANFTRRNLQNLNLETNVVVTGQSEMDFFVDAQKVMDTAWSNTDTRIYSRAYETFSDVPWWHVPLYRFMEWGGMSTF